MHEAAVLDKQAVHLKIGEGKKQTQWRSGKFSPIYAGVHFSIVGLDANLIFRSVLHFQAF